MTKVHHEKNREQTRKSLQDMIGDRYLIKDVLAKDIKKDNYLRNTQMLIFPGGRDKPYQKKLSPLGNLKIKEFVKAGGSYLGICAGSYYAGNKVEFSLDNHHHKISEYRELGFFSGVVKGPMYPGFSYSRSTGVKAVEMIFSDYSSNT